ncbi:MAG: tRNA (adenosine(37)-N6)-threonylcarbamoyltransferase complex dimerization subunit type 1 TsaB [Chitinophagaceae bacterium]|nr:MAG: tRNA (adenosine(37)-N6)-threonylcarbamoyltransferase complex dimerization subunit type 1 TsaB [Chitinophagaceae bacterium]
MRYSVFLFLCAVALLLHIETAVSGASIAFSEDEQLLHFRSTEEQRESAAWLQVAIRDAAAACNLSLQRLDAVCVSAGPGSYTGLRVGMASAKGLCYALQKPLIALPTLQIMAASAASTAQGILCPMIDARRMEVFAALYNGQLQELSPAQSVVLDESSFAEQLAAGPVTFFGNGSVKWLELCQHPNAHFVTEGAASAQAMPALGAEAYRKAQFADLAYCEPLYAKEFYTTMQPKSK